MIKSYYYVSVSIEDIKLWFNCSRKKAYEILNVIREKNLVDPVLPVTRAHVAKAINIELEEFDAMIMQQSIHQQALEALIQKLTVNPS